MKKIHILLVFTLLMLSGCAKNDLNKEQEPLYFEQVHTKLSSLTGDEITSGQLVNLWIKESTHTGMYENKVYTACVDGESYSFDLKEWLGEAEQWEWQTAGIFSKKENGRTYICLVDFNMVYEKGTIQSPQILLIDYNTAKPEEYTVSCYEVEPQNLFAWVDQCYLMGDSIYIASGNELCAINLQDKSFYNCQKEYEKIEELVKGKYTEESYHPFFFRAILHEDEKIVYSAVIAEANDTNPIAAIYIAFEDGVLIDHMIVEFTGK